MTDTLPIRRNATREALPPSRGNRPQRVLPAKLNPVDQTLFILLTNADSGQWYLVDEFRGSTGTPSPLKQALWRRGCEVRQIQSEDSPGDVQVWARWTWDVPDRVAPWEVIL